MELPQNILMERLLALLRASDEMMKSVFHHNRQGTLDMLARSVKELLAAEAAAIFLVDEDSPDELVLSAYELDKPVRLRKVRLKIQDVPHGGMTGYIAYTGEIIRLHGEELRGHQNNAHSSTEHLISGVGFSTLGIPLKDRKGRVLGIAKVDNKKGPDGAACEEAFFDEVDEFVARILLNKIVLVLETLCNFDAIRTLMEAMRRAGKLEDLLDEILKTGVRLIGADRGDFVRWDEHRRQLVPAAQYGGEKPEHDQVWPERSVVDEVWRTQESALISDVRSDPKYRDIYYEIQPSTRSEIAVCLVSEGKTVGVLNAESSKVDWFDAHDLE
ncbi:MAG TPA: GAF domain-containing protein, partial [Pyrinomonadaceae bacterium]|nr:GAF domain-containing protein [Pyrinomonadaceae bacterium]